jgi:predicted SnoaL-like aldol condensation-catalyzing enzyme
VSRIILFLLLTCGPVAAFAALPAQQDLADPSQSEKNKAVARRVFDEIFNQGKLQVANEIYATDFVNHGLHRNAGLSEDQAAVQWEKQVLPDLKLSVDLIAANGDLVTVVWRATGTNTRQVGWLPATGVLVELKGITVWRIVDGRIREEWTAFDMLRVVLQVAALLKWQIMALLSLAVISAWTAIRLIRRIMVVHFARKA